MTKWVIDAAIRQIVAWRDAGSDIPVSINVSPVNLEESGFADRLMQRLLLARLPSTALDFEVTESALIRDGSRVCQQLRQMRAAGIKISIDDFGTGYSSLSYLQDLPADVIKIDQSFIRSLTVNDRARTLVRSMVTLAKGMTFKVVAEGIEDQSSYDLLRNAGCDEGQGYWMARPLSAVAFAQWLGQNRRDAREEAA